MVVALHAVMLWQGNLASLLLLLLPLLTNLGAASNDCECSLLHQEFNTFLKFLTGMCS